VTETETPTGTEACTLRDQILNPAGTEACRYIQPISPGTLDVPGLFLPQQTDENTSSVIELIASTVAPPLLLEAACTFASFA
jgi:hypothetical protein